MKRYSQLQGDGGSDLVLQIHEQRKRIDANLSGITHLVGIASGKGGVGKSTLTFALGSALHALGNRVCLLDLDFNGPSLATFGKLEGRPLMLGERGLGIPETASGLKVLSLGSALGPGLPLEFETVADTESHVWRATQEFSFLAQLLESAEFGDLDFLLLDLPPGTERTFQLAEFFGPRLALVLVTIPTAISYGVVERTVTLLEQLPNRVLGYIENMAGYACTGCGRIGELFPEHGGTLALPKLGSVPFDPQLATLGSADAAAAPGVSAQYVDLIARDLLTSLTEDRYEVSLR